MKATAEWFRRKSQKLAEQIGGELVGEAYIAKAGNGGVAMSHRRQSIRCERNGIKYTGSIYNGYTDSPMLAAVLTPVDRLDVPPLDGLCDGEIGGVWVVIERTQGRGRIAEALGE